MEKLVSLYTIAQDIETNLNDLVTTLLSSQDITEELVFRVYDDYEEYVKANDVNVILNGNIDPNQVHQLYVQTYVLQILGYRETEDDLKTVLNQYATNNAGAITKLDNWDIVKDFSQTPLFTQITTHKGYDRIIGQVAFNYTFVIDGVLSNDCSLSVDGVEMPVLNFASERTKLNNTKNHNFRKSFSSLKKGQA